MSCQSHTYNYYNFANSTELTIITHGISDGIESGLMQKIKLKLLEQQKSFVFIQFPYRDRGETKSSGPELKEEIKTIESILSLIDLDNYKKFTLLANL